MIDGLQQTNISLSRGIVRTPSLGEDGELSECVNLIPHKGEIVRIKEPQALGIELQEGEILLETNRCVGKENYITRRGNALACYRPEEDPQEICDLTEGDVEVVTIGQTIVVSQGTTKRYFVWGEGGYREQNLSGILPRVEVRLGDKGFRSVHDRNADISATAAFETYSWKAGKTNLYIERDFANEIDNAYWMPHESNASDLNTSFWGRYNEIRKRFKDAGAHCFPFYVRWGIELYDGSITNLSAPILMMPSSVIRPFVGWYLPDYQSYIKVNTLNTEVVGQYWVIGFTPRNLYVTIDASDLEGIDESLVKGVTVFITPEIEAVDSEAELFAKSGRISFHSFKESVKDGLGWDTSFWDNHATAARHFNYMTYLPAKKNTRAIALAFNDPVEFYELANIPWQSIKEKGYKLVASLQEGKLPSNKDKDTSSPAEDPVYTELKKQGYTPYAIDLSLDTLTSQRALSNALISQQNYTVAKANSTYSYNSRLIYGGVDLKIPLAINSGQILTDNKLPNDEDAADTSLAVNLGGSYLTIEDDGLLSRYKGESAVIAFPHKDAEGLAIFREDNSWGASTLFNSNKYALGGYSLWSGITEELIASSPDLKGCFLKQSIVGDEWKTNSYLESKASDLKGNTIALTKVGNPWIIEQVTELACGEIYALTSATEALSEGQFGEFPVYAFTDTGIYALSISQDGTIEAKQAISRDVLLGKNTTLQIDKAVIYPTKEGLKIISGRNTSLLSSAVDGLNINEIDFSSSIPDKLNIPDTRTFQEQLANMQMVYDYAHGLVHLFSKEEVVQGKSQKHYVYDIESQQWATQILDTQLTTVVAGYPFSTMQFGNKLMQYTNALEADVVRSGWLLTRPLAFDDPWARKMIADIRIMAQKTNQDSKVSLAIYTSDYRVNWRKLTSLKSRSAKWYRFLIKADFCGLDSLSGVTCRWVQRLGNKLR
jgi:hypothetical protein